ncbi:Glycosyl transferase, group 1 [hydrothermal vent metagenome]|uniref:Glycosyl transferase, group 1 n=1 Tax=hydrothermal vent metagenome TaxID=652676 RepID=A0A3B1BK23_9ZZZZ
MLRWKSGRVALLHLFFEILSHDDIIFQKTYSRYHKWAMKWAKLLGKRCYLDIDDAPSRINATKTLKNFREMLVLADGVFAGSNNLVEYCKPYQINTWLIPSSIYLKHYLVDSFSNDKICLCWIGNGKYYKQDLIGVLLEPLKQIAAKHPVRLKLIGACGEKELYQAFSGIKGLEIDFIDTIEWSSPAAVSKAMQNVDIGLYPLISNDFNYYKCGFKALEYMAIGIPVVSSSVAINIDIIGHGKDGYLVDSTDEWIAALNDLICNAAKRQEMGDAGRKKVEQYYSVDKTASLIGSLITCGARG